MRSTMQVPFGPCLRLFVVLTILTGAAYPALVTVVAQAAFPHQANGSLVFRDGRLVGSALLGQAYSNPRYFHGRPSATAPLPYDGAGSTGSNLGPMNPALIAEVRARVAALRAADPDATGPVPADLVTASASGLDPHLSPAAAEYQVLRVARARHMDPRRVRALVLAHTEPRTLGVLGEPRVNVLELNLALDASAPRD